jgi:hypothetical protein
VFGLFGKPDLENSSFNNALIACLSDSVRRSGRFPSDGELIGAITELVKNRKLTPSQINSIRACALEINSFSWGESELKPLIKKMQMEMPVGGRESYDKIIKLLSSHALIVTDEALEFMSKYGLK